MSSRLKKKPSRNYPTAWSKWEWNEQYQRHARYREVSEGDWEWDYAELTPRDPSTLPPASLPAVDESDPSEHYSHEGGLADFAQRFEGLTIASYAEGQQYPAEHHYPAEQQYPAAQRYSVTVGEYNQEYFESSKTDSGNSKGTETKCPECSMTFLRSTELERHHKTVHLNNGVRLYECLVPGCPGNVRSWKTVKGLRLHEKNWHGPHPCSVPGCSRRDPFGFSSEEDLEIHQAEHSGGLNLDQHTRKFAIHSSRDFYFGRIFKVLWSEPVGTGGTEITPPGQHGERAFHKVRRFLIVSEKNKGHSICIPISTYGNQGVLKRGVCPEDHAAVFTGKREGPYLLPGEKDLMTKEPIRIEMHNPAERLDPLSRLNFAKLYTVEHNVKVLFIGRVAKNYERALKVAYNEAHPPFDPGPVSYKPKDNSYELAGMAEQDNPQNLFAATPTSAATSYPSSQSYPQSYPFAGPGPSYVSADATVAYTAPPYSEPSYFSTDATAYPATASSSQTAQAAKYSPYDDAYD